MSDTPAPVSGDDLVAEEWADDSTQTVAPVRDLFVTFAKALRAFQLYDENNPVYQRFVSALRQAFIDLWSELPSLALLVEEDRFVFEEIDPSTDEAAQAQVYQSFGARPMTLGLFSDEQFYLYGFLETGGRLEQLDLTAEGVSAATVREAIENSLRRQTPGFLKTVGVVTSDQGLPREVLMQLQMQGQRVPPQPPP